ncbi:MAG: CubicO group peptidase (beta-lactamase class C family) [Saprospiraceae bacterium]|jgi:CubicO group peptidase (beta-lactamase class C family)
MPLRAQSTENNKAITTKIDTYLNASVSNGFSGSVLVAIKGEVILSKGYGWSDRKNKIPNASSSIFNIGSVTKQFTASAILKLVEQGKIKTSDKISQFYDKAPDDKKNITIHQLLTHTSGISARTGGFRYDEASKEQFLKEFFDAELQSEPGKKHQYANANYIMLAAILELVSKQNYVTFLHENLWEQSHMTNTGYKGITFNSERLAHGYYFNIADGIWKDWGTTQEHLPYNDKHWYSIGKGDIHSSVEDLYKWHLALNDSRVLTSKTRELQETPHVAENDSATSHYGYGWALFNSDRSTKIVTHNGSNGVYFADFIRFIDEDVVIIYLTNAILGNDTENVGWEISKMIFNPEYEAHPVSKNRYELVFEFIKINELASAQMLPSYLTNELGKKFDDHSVLNSYGYRILKKENEPGWAMELFKLNVQLFPEDGNLWDSLGEAYLKYGEKEQAIRSYTKAVELGNKDSQKTLTELLKN